MKMKDEKFEMPLEIQKNTIDFQSTNDKNEQEDDQRDI